MHTVSNKQRQCSVTHAALVLVIPPVHRHDLRPVCAGQSEDDKQDLAAEVTTVDKVAVLKFFQQT